MLNVIPSIGSEPVQNESEPRIHHNRCRIALAALLLMSVGFPGHAARAELRLSTPESGYERLLSVSEQIAGESQTQLQAAVEHFQNNRSDDCLKLLKEAAERTPGLPPAELMFARMFLRSGNAVESLRRLDRLAVEMPEQPEVFVSLGELALRQGRLTDAWLQLDRAATLPPPAAWDAARLKAYRIELGQLQSDVAERREDWPTAERLARGWSELDPESAEALLSLGRCRLAQEQVEEALDLFRRARRLDANTPAAEVIAALIFARRGNHERAADWFGRAASDPAATPAVRLEYARWLLEQERPEDAQSQLSQIPDSEDTDLLRAYLQGLTARCLRDNAVAEQAFLQLQRSNPGDWAAANQLALVLIESDDEAKRVRASQLAQANLSQCPDRALALATAGWVQLRLGDLANAERLLQQSLAAGPVTPSTRYYVSRLLSARGRPEESDKWLNEALSQPGYFPERHLLQAAAARAKSSN